MRRRQAILHIGTAKTGSTTIQRLLAQHRDRLPAHGFAYPTSPGAKNHFRLVICGADPDIANAMARQLGEVGDAAAVAQRFRQELAAELAALPDSVHTVIFSNEHCYAKIDSAVAAARLRDFLAPFFDGFRIVAYLRRQDELAVSRYTTRLRAGGVETLILPRAGDVDAGDQAAGDDADDQQAGRPAGSPDRQGYDWATMLDRWATAFGKAAVCPRVFARDAFTGGDLMLDFQDACGMAAVFEPGARAQNSSLLPAAQEFLRRCNVARRDATSGRARRRPMPTVVKQHLDRAYAGPGRQPARADAEAFVAGFAEANGRLRAGYFPYRARVFSADFSKYPVREDPLPGDADVLEVALSVLVREAADAAGRAAETSTRRGKALPRSGDTATAAHGFRRALAAMPGRRRGAGRPGHHRAGCRKRPTAPRPDAGGTGGAPGAPGGAGGTPDGQDRGGVVRPDGMAQRTGPGGVAPVDWPGRSVRWSAA